MKVSLLDDYQWLVSPAGTATLGDMARHAGSLVTRTRQLRATLSRSRAHLILEQLELRERARAKFPAADRMYFTRRGLEQATEWAIARAKARRFPADGTVFDLCCGLGGDLLALAERTPTVGIELDPVMALLARANGLALGRESLAVEADDALRTDLVSCDAWHIDPDRRPLGKRTSQLMHSRPSTEQIMRLLAVCSHAALKLAPADEPQLARDAQREWYGSRGECRQQVVWLGNLARYPGCHTATVIDPVTQREATLTGLPGPVAEMSPAIGPFIHEPHAAVIAAQLTGALAAREGFQALAPRVAYLTSDTSRLSPLWDSFAVLDVLPFDQRRLRHVFRQQRIGQLEVKKRGVPIDPVRWQTQFQRHMKNAGDQSATLLVLPWNGKVRAILAQRVRPLAEDDPTVTR